MVNTYRLGGEIQDNSIYANELNDLSVEKWRSFVPIRSTFCRPTPDVGDELTLAGLR